MAYFEAPYPFPRSNKRLFFIIQRDEHFLYTFDAWNGLVQVPVPHNPRAYSLQRSVSTTPALDSTFHHVFLSNVLSSHIVPSKRTITDLVVKTIATVVPILVITSDQETLTAFRCRDIAMNVSQQIVRIIDDHFSRCYHVKIIVNVTMDVFVSFRSVRRAT